MQPGHMTTDFDPQMGALVDMENSGLVPLLVGDQYEDLGRMYALFRRVDGGLDLLRSVMGAHLKKEGSQLVQARRLAALNHNLMLQRDLQPQD